MNWNQTFSTYQVTRLFRTVSKRQLQYWDEQKIVGVKKNGHARVYTSSDVLLVGIFDTLRRRGMSTQEVRGMATALRLSLSRVGKRVPPFIVAEGKTPYFETLEALVVKRMAISSKRAVLIRTSDVLERINSKTQSANAVQPQPVSTTPKSAKTK